MIKNSNSEGQVSRKNSQSKQQVLPLKSQQKAEQKVQISSPKSGVSAYQQIDECKKQEELVEPQSVVLNTNSNGKEQKTHKLQRKATMIEFKPGCVCDLNQKYQLKEEKTQYKSKVVFRNSSEQQKSSETNFQKLQRRLSNMEIHENFLLKFDQQYQKIQEYNKNLNNINSKYDITSMWARGNKKGMQRKINELREKNMNANKFYLKYNGKKYYQIQQFEEILPEDKKNSLITQLNSFKTIVSLPNDPEGLKLKKHPTKYMNEDGDFVTKEEEEAIQNLKNMQNKKKSKTQMLPRNSNQATPSSHSQVLDLQRNSFKVSAERFSLLQNPNTMNSSNAGSVGKASNVSSGVTEERYYNSDSDQENMLDGLENNSDLQEQDEDEEESSSQQANESQQRNSQSTANKNQKDRHSVQKNSVIVVRSKNNSIVSFDNFECSNQLQQQQGAALTEEEIKKKEKKENKLKIKQMLQEIPLEAIFYYQREEKAFNELSEMLQNKIKNLSEKGRREVEGYLENNCEKFYKELLKSIPTQKIYNGRESTQSMLQQESVKKQLLKLKYQQKSLDSGIGRRISKKKFLEKQKKPSLVISVPNENGSQFHLPILNNNSHKVNSNTSLLLQQQQQQQQQQMDINREKTEAHLEAIKNLQKIQNQLLQQENKQHKSSHTLSNQRLSLDSIESKNLETLANKYEKMREKFNKKLKGADIYENTYKDLSKLGPGSCTSRINSQHNASSNNILSSKRYIQPTMTSNNITARNQKGKFLSHKNLDSYTEIIRQEDGMQKSCGNCQKNYTILTDSQISWIQQKQNIRYGQKIKEFSDLMRNKGTLVPQDVFDSTKKLQSPYFNSDTVMGRKTNSMRNLQGFIKEEDIKKEYNIQNNSSINYLMQ